MVVELAVLQQGFAKHYGGGGGVGGGRGCARGRECGCPLSPSLYIGGREEGEAP